MDIPVMDILKDKVSKKQIVAIVGILTVADPYLRAAICVIAILAQAILDWRKPAEVLKTNT